jgi:predicted ester cyclase
MSTPEEAKAVIRRWNDEGWSGGNYELAHEIIAPVMTVHGAGGQAVGMGPDGLIQLIKTWRTAFPDGTMAVDDLIVEGDLVGIRNTWSGTQTGEFYGIPPTGRHVEVTSVGLDRVTDGQVVEGWGELDMVGMMQQLGVMPMAGPGAIAQGKASSWGATSTTAGEATTTPEDNKGLLVRFVNALAAADTETLQALVDADAFVDHNPVWGSVDLAGAVAMAETLRAAIPDLELSIETDIIVAEGDQAEAHSILTGTHTGADLFGVAASDSELKWTHTDFVRIANGKIVERWVSADTLTLLQQAGVLPGGAPPVRHHRHGDVAGA